MRYRTFLVTGVEVLQLGGQHWDSNAWPIDHWRKNSGRLRLFTMAIDAQVSAALAGRSYGGPVEGFAVAMEIADFAAWPEATFAKRDAATSYKSKYKDLWAYAKLDWAEIRSLSLRQQVLAYGDAVLESLARHALSKRIPSGFRVEQFSSDLGAVFRSLKPSTLTRTAYAKSAA